MTKSDIERLFSEDLLYNWGLMDIHPDQSITMTFKTMITSLTPQRQRMLNHIPENRPGNIRQVCSQEGKHTDRQTDRVIESP